MCQCSSIKKLLTYLLTAGRLFSFWASRRLRATATSVGASLFTIIFFWYRRLIILYLRKYALIFFAPYCQVLNTIINGSTMCISEREFVGWESRRWHWLGQKKNRQMHFMSVSRRRSTPVSCQNQRTDVGAGYSSLAEILPKYELLGCFRTHSVCPNLTKVLAFWKHWHPSHEASWHRSGKSLYYPNRLMQSEPHWVDSTTVSSPHPKQLCMRIV